MPRLLDLFCGAGGAAMGYSLAGFDEIVGVDIAEQKRYPFEFVQGDALEFLRKHGREFDAIHASPPCQSYSKAMGHLANPKPMLLEPSRIELTKTGRRFVIENVVGAPMPTAVTVCGTHFGLRVYRHRLFESNATLRGTRCDHSRPAWNPHQASGRKAIEEETGRSCPEKQWRYEMGVGWMSKAEARESIPPAYTKFVGEQLLAQL